MRPQAKITGINLCTSITDDAAVLYAAVRAGLKNLEQVPFSIAAGDDFEMHHVYCYPIQELAGMPHRQKIKDLLTNTMLAVLLEINKHPMADRIRFHIVTPPESEIEDSDDYLMKMILDVLGGDIRFQFRCSSAEQGAMNALRESIERLESGQCDYVIFGGVDSLINSRFIKTFATTNRLLTDQFSDGVGLGEACAFIHLTRPENKKTPGLGYITGLATEPEPEHGRADETHLQALSKSILHLAEELGVEPASFETVIHNLGSDLSSAIEWKQVQDAVWPNRLPENLRVAVQLGEVAQADNPNQPMLEEVLPYLGLGEIGAASLPVQIALAVAKFKCDRQFAKYGIEATNKILVCETNNTQWRGALCLTPQTEMQ